MNNSLILQGKRAVVFGAAAAREFAAEGAEVFLSGRTKSNVETVAKQVTANAAVLVASDRARMFTGTVVNATAGAALD